MITLLDTYSGFSHLLLSLAMQNLLTIVTSLGLMRWKTLSFGPKNAPPEFQAAVNEVFKELRAKPWLAERIQRVVVELHTCRYHRWMQRHEQPTREQQSACHSARNFVLATWPRRSSILES